MDKPAGRRFRSREWFADPHRSDMTAPYLERFMNFGLTPEELRSGRPIVGIAQTGSDLSPCNRIHLDLARRVRDGIRDAGGIPMEFPVHPIFENCRRPSAALDRNLAYLGLVETRPAAAAEPMQPAGQYLGERFFRAGGVPARRAGVRRRNCTPPA
jgi:dihydroxyacid dehydratase/phosphogluconate dehydratase